MTMDTAANLNAPFDVLLTGGQVINGTGETPPFRADVGIQNGHIVFVGLSDAQQKDTARRVFDVSGKFVAPGFIDIHTHSDLSVLFTPQMDSSLAQGVTTEVVGNCGFSVALAKNTDEFAGEKSRLERGNVSLDWSGFRRISAPRTIRRRGNQYRNLGRTRNPAKAHNGNGSSRRICR